MNLLLAAILSTAIDLLYALMLFSGLVSLALVIFIAGTEANERIRTRLNRRRRWKEIETARSHLILDERVAGRRRVGVSDRESVAGRRAS
jgi:hypothetical protein